MKIIYARQPIDASLLAQGSVFLAGPTPRSPDVKSWRPEAIDLFRQHNYNGTLLIPEDEDGGCHGNYDHQVEWEEKGLELASCIMFWIPRNLKTMPGLTTNDEWGVWKTSGKVVLGAPSWADKVSYQFYYARKLNVPNFRYLEATVLAAIEMSKHQVDVELR